LKKLLLFLLSFIPALCTSEAFSQLLPSIGIASLPNDDDSVCAIPIYTGSFDSSGYQQGDTAHDFTLYDLNGEAVNFATVLNSGKPTLLVGGSYTCPVFRGKIADINNMVAIYGSSLNIYIIYTVEAHPINDPSPYSGSVWVPSANYTEGVLFEQPATYGERKALIDSMLDNYTINAPILVDGPCNNWWLNYGPAPNNAYLIDTNGIVVAKHPWFHRPPQNMYCDIDSLLGTASGNCIIYTNDGSFSFGLDDDSIAYGFPGETLGVHGSLVNLSSTDNVVIDIIKRQWSLPSGWQSAICADICYAATVDSTRITLAPQQIQPYTHYFYTDTIPSQGWVRVLFRNVYDTNNRFGQTFMGYTNTTAITETYENDAFAIYPNPLHSYSTLYLKNVSSHSTLKIYNTLGALVKAQSITSENTVITREGLSEGIYFVVVYDEAMNYRSKIVVE
jgi:hypothetical protein